MQRGMTWTLVDGTPAIMKMNAESAPKLDTPDRALAYLRFYVGFLEETDHGRWKLIDHVGDVDWFPTASGELRATLAARIKPLILESGSDQDWKAIGTIQYGNAFWEASFHLARNGDLTTQRSRLIEQELPVYLDAFSNGIRVQRTMAQMNEGKPQRDLAKVQKTLAANPKDEDALKELPGIYYRLRSWKDAVEAGQKWVDFLKAQPETRATKTVDLREAYIALTVYQLLARNFTGALASSEAARKVDPSSLIAEAAYAHALLFSGRTEEAEKIFLANGGKKSNPTSDEVWEQLVFGDWSVLEQDGLTNPSIAHIRDLMTQQQDQRDLARYEQDLKADTKDEKALQLLPHLYFKAERWKDAADTEKKRLAYVKEVDAASTKKTDDLRNTYEALAWYQLFAHDFAGALASSEAGRKLDPSYLLNDTNRAHALLLVGRTQEAEALYLGNVGKKMNSNSEQTWEQAILADFTSMEQGGITNAEIPRIRRLLNLAQYDHYLAQYEQQLKTNPKDEDALRYLPHVYYNLGRWKDAVETEKNFVAFLRSKPDSDTSKMSDLRETLSNLSWYEILARDFAEALATSEEAMKLDPASLYAVGNHAHALLALGRTQEAETVYIANVGKKMEPDTDKTWEETIREDFTSMEKEGIATSEIARIRKLLDRAQNEQLLAFYQQQFAKNPNDENAVRRLPNVYFSLERWKEAVDAEKAYVAFLQRQSKHDAAWSSALSGAYVGLAWYQLYIRDFAGSLASSDEAIKLGPADLAAQTNRAHALVFLGRTKEAEEVYLKHRGEKVFAGSDEIWEHAILNDFDDLERAGITNAEFARIRELFKSPAK
jgi:tetratricopeptide (TPR) repeat protein